MYSRGRTKIARERQVKKRAANALREREEYPDPDGGTIVGRSIPNTREINLPMSYVCKRRPFQLLNCHGSLPSVEPRETFELPRLWQRDSELLIMLTEAARNIVSQRMHALSNFEKNSRNVPPLRSAVVLLTRALRDNEQRRGELRENTRTK